jgi:hypothetical protein
LDLARAKLADMVKIDVLSENQAIDNEAMRRKIARNFICAYSIRVRTNASFHEHDSGHFDRPNEGNV